MVHTNIRTNYMKNRLLMLLMTWFMVLGCIDKNKSSIQNNEYPKILTFSLGYIFKNNQMAAAYYNQPLQLLANIKYPLKESVSVNGQQCLILPANTDIDKLLSTMDIYHPVPLVEILEFKNNGQTADLNILFRATGHNFLLTVKKTQKGGYVIGKVTERTI